MDGSDGDDTIDVSNNVFDHMHAGWDSTSDIGYYTTSFQCVKFRRGNHRVRLHEHTSVEMDSADWHPESNRHIYATCLQFVLEMNATDAIRKPYNISIYNNYCSTFVMSDSAAASAAVPGAQFCGTAFNINGMPNAWVGDIDTTIRVFNLTPLIPRVVM